MVRLLHTADLHLDSPLRSRAMSDPVLRQAIENATRSALTRIIDTALEEGVAALLIAGDLYDGDQTSMKTAAFLIGEFQRLDAAGIRVFIIRGNHDASSSIPARIGWPANVHVFDGRGKPVELGETGIVIHGVSFTDRHAPDSLVPRYRPVPGKINIAMLHTSLGGAQGHDPYAPCAVADLVGAGFDYWALGHIHARAIHHENPFVVMPGMPQGRDIGESGPKSATLIHVDDDGIRIEERPTASIVFQRVTHDISGASDFAEVLAGLRDFLQTYPVPTPTVLRLHLSGRTSTAWQIRRDLDLVRETAVDAAPPGRLWIDKVVLDVEPDGDARDTGAAGEISALISDIAESDGFAATAADIVMDLVAELPADLRDRFGADDDGRISITADLIRRAKAHAAARMHAGGDGSD